MQQGKNYCSSCAVLLEEMFPPPYNYLDCFEKSITCTLSFRLTKKLLKHAIKKRTEKREQQTRQVEESLHTFFDICFRVFDISYLQHYTFSWRLLCMAPKHGRNRRQLPFNYLPFFCLRA